MIEYYILPLIIGLIIVALCVIDLRKGKNVSYNQTDIAKVLVLAFIPIVNIILAVIFLGMTLYEHAKKLIEKLT